MLTAAGRAINDAAPARIVPSSPQAVGGASRAEPFAPAVPRHHTVASGGFIRGFSGDWKKAHNALDQTDKLALLKQKGLPVHDEAESCTEKSAFV